MRKFLSFLCAGLLAFLLAAPLVQAQVAPRNLTTLTLTATTAAANATTVITSQAVQIKPGAGFAVIPNFQLSGADTANMTFNFAVSTDGTTWTTITPFTYAEASNGTTPVIGFKNFGVAAGADNVLYVRLASVTNASTTRTLTINSIVVTRNN
jgi:hypothetical protein